MVTRLRNNTTSRHDYCIILVDYSRPEHSKWTKRIRWKEVNLFLSCALIIRSLFLFWEGVPPRWWKEISKLRDVKCQETIKSQLRITITSKSFPVLESMRAREPGLQALSNLAGSKIKNTHVFFPHEFFLGDMISNIGKSTCHVSCIYSEGKAIKTNFISKI